MTTLCQCGWHVSICRNGERPAPGKPQSGALVSAISQARVLHGRMRRGHRRDSEWLVSYTPLCGENEPCCACVFGAMYSRYAVPLLGNSFSLIGGMWIVATLMRYSVIYTPAHPHLPDSSTLRSNRVRHHVSVTNPPLLTRFSRDCVNASSSRQRTDMDMV